MKHHRHLLAATGLCAALALTGCWGGSDDDPPPEAATAVPDSAGVSSASFISFIQGLIANDETSEPLTISDTFAVPADES